MPRPTPDDGNVLFYFEDRYGYNIAVIKLDTPHDGKYSFATMKNNKDGDSEWYVPFHETIDQALSAAIEYLGIKLRVTVGTS